MKIENSLTKVAVIGASTKPFRASYTAILKLQTQGYDVIAIGSKPGTVKDVEIRTDQPMFDDIHTVSLYLRPEHQKNLTTYLLALKPTRIIFNPGTENGHLYPLFEENGIKILEACTLVMLSTNTFNAAGLDGPIHL